MSDTAKVRAYIDAVAGETRRRDAETLLEMMTRVIGTHSEQLARLGEHTTGVGCLYLKDLYKVDLTILESIIGESHRTVTAGTFGHRAADSGGDSGNG